MKIASPRHRGVQTLMAVADAEVETKAPLATLEEAIDYGSLFAVALWGAGQIFDNRTMSDAGLGAGLALVGLRFATRPR